MKKLFIEIVVRFCCWPSSTSWSTRTGIKSIIFKFFFKLQDKNKLYIYLRNLLNCHVLTLMSVLYLLHVPNFAPTPRAPTSVPVPLDLFLKVRVNIVEQMERI